VADSEGSGATGEIIWRDVSSRIRQARADKGLTQRMLAVAITPEGARPTHEITITNFETQGKRIPLDRIEAIALATGRSVRWLLFGDVVPLDVETIIARAKSEAFEEAERAMNGLRLLYLKGTAAGVTGFAYGGTFHDATPNRVHDAPTTPPPNVERLTRLHEGAKADAAAAADRVAKKAAARTRRKKS
jgi:hypothetical protein